jgi:hypothetical protein
LQQGHGPRDRTEPSRARSIGQHRHRIGIFQHFGNAVIGKRWVDRGIGPACLEHRDLRRIEHWRGARQQQRHDPLCLQSRREVKREPVGQLSQLGISHHLPLRPGTRRRNLYRDPLRSARGRFGKEGVQQRRTDIGGGDHPAAHRCAQSGQAVDRPETVQDRAARDRHYPLCDDGAA